METKSNSFIAKFFGIPESDVVWYHGGICYDKIVVTTPSSAAKISAALEGKYVNGGMFDGMPLGSISEVTDANNKKVYEIMC